MKLIKITVMEQLECRVEFVIYLLGFLLFMQLDRARAHSGRFNGNGAKKPLARDQALKAVPAPEANAELQANIDV